jgi:PqqD family protein of HPr-rel-A system
LIFAEADGEAVALNASKGKCYGLNNTGLRILQLIEAPASATDICAQLVKEFQVDPTTCEEQVGNLLTELELEGLVVMEPTGQAF